MGRGKGGDKYPVSIDHAMEVKGSGHQDSRNKMILSDEAKKAYPHIKKLQPADKVTSRKRYVDFNLPKPDKK